MSPHFSAYADLALDAITEQLGGQEIDEFEMSQVVGVVYAALVCQQEKLDALAAPLRRHITEMVIGVLEEGITIPF